MDDFSNLKIGDKELFSHLEEEKKKARMELSLIPSHLAQEKVNTVLNAKKLSTKKVTGVESIPIEYENLSTIMSKYNPIDISSILIRINNSSPSVIIVGGQAINLWALKYQENNKEFTQYMPFSSEDLDCYGGRIEAMECHQAMGGKLILNRDFDSSPNSGILIVDNQQQKFRIDFLASVYGLNDAEIVETAQQYYIEGLDNPILVLHPILCLEGKLKSLMGLPQQGRQDLKHLQMSILFVKEFIKEIILFEPSCTGLKLVERVISNVVSEKSLAAWYQNGIEIESAIPWDVITELNDEKWLNFSEIRIPQLQKFIREKRNTYTQLMKNIENIRTDNLELE